MPAASTWARSEHIWDRNATACIKARYGGPPFRRRPLFMLQQRGAPASRSRSWVRLSDTVCATLRETAAMSSSRVAETLANGVAADPLLCDLLANLHLEHV